MGTMDSAVGSGSLTESVSLNVEARSSDTLNAVVSIVVSCFKTIRRFVLKLHETAKKRDHSHHCKLLPC